MWTLRKYFLGGHKGEGAIKLLRHRKGTITFLLHKVGLLLWGHKKDTITVGHKKDFFSG